jgi:hypothetical protein
VAASGVGAVSALVAVSGLGAASALVVASLASPGDFLPWWRGFGGVVGDDRGRGTYRGQESNSGVSGSRTVSRMTRGGCRTRGGGDE